jgi:hypothetical protein
MDFVYMDHGSVYDLVAGLSVQRSAETVWSDCSLFTATYCVVLNILNAPTKTLESRELTSLSHLSVLPHMLSFPNQTSRLPTLKHTGK